MKQILAILSLVAALFAGAPAVAQNANAVVVAACGTPPAAYPAGSNRQVTQDTSGRACGASTSTPSGTQDENLKQVNGATVNVGTGASGSGTQRVAVASDSSLSPLRATTTNRSGTIATGGTSQQLAASNAARNRILVTNPSSATNQGIGTAETCQINFTSAASPTAGGSIDLPTGWSFDTGGGPVPTDQINIVCATTGHLYTAKEW